MKQVNLKFSKTNVRRKKMRKEFVSRQQLEMLPERIRKAEETDATKELKQYMWEMFEKNSYFPMNF